jgi:hypothetical protein
METVQLDILTAISEKQRGIEKAENTADAINPNWRNEAFEVLKEFLLTVPGEFLVEDVRAYAAVKNFVAPASNRVWGSVVVRAAREGLIKNIGYGVTKNKKAHRTPASIWIKNY